jgi:hypothetical protein
MAAALWLASGLSSPAAADIRLDGNVRDLHLIATGDSLADVLSRLDVLLAIKCRSAIPLQAEVRGTFSGSLSEVVSRLLDGYNYIIRNERELTEIVVFGRAGAVAIVPRAAAARAGKTVASRWR